MLLYHEVEKIPAAKSTLTELSEFYFQQLLLLTYKNPCVVTTFLPIIVIRHSPSETSIRFYSSTSKSLNIIGVCTRSGQLAKQPSFLMTCGLIRPIFICLVSSLSDSVNILLFLTAIKLLVKRSLQRAYTSDIARERPKLIKSDQFT